MKQKIISLIAMIVSLCAFVAAVSLLIFSITRHLNNTGAIIFLVIAITLVMLFSVFNYIITIYSLKSADNTADTPPVENTENE